MERVILAAALAAACGQGYTESTSTTTPPSQSSPDAGPPKLTSIVPDMFVPDGGTPFTIRGENIGTDTQVLFDGVAIPSTWAPPNLFAKTPPHEKGATFVKLVNGDGQASIPLGIDITWGADTSRVIDCVINRNSGLTVPSGWMEFDALVAKPYVTTGAGQGPGIEMQLGIVPAGAIDGTWSWIPAAYSGDWANFCPYTPDGDEYATYAQVGPAGEYRFAFRARYLSGPWSWCEADGMYPAMEPASLGTLTVQ